MAQVPSKAFPSGTTGMQSPGNRSRNRMRQIPAVERRNTIDIKARLMDDSKLSQHRPVAWDSFE